MRLASPGPPHLRSSPSSTLSFGLGLPLPSFTPSVFLPLDCSLHCNNPISLTLSLPLPQLQFISSKINFYMFAYFLKKRLRLTVSAPFPVPARSPSLPDPLLCRSLGRGQGEWRSIYYFSVFTGHPVSCAMSCAPRTQCPQSVTHPKSQGQDDLLGLTGKSSGTWDPPVSGAVPTL